MTTVDCVLRWEATLGEVPVWSPRDGLLYWVDIRAPALHAFDRRTGANRSWTMPEAIGAVAIHSGGGLLLALASGLARFDPAEGTLTPIQPIEADNPGSRLNDGRCDRQGRFWVGSMTRGKTGAGSLYCYHADGTLDRLFGAITIPNGLAVSPDGRWLHFCDSPTGRLTRHALDPDTGAIGPSQPFVTCEPPGDPDGAVFDAEGYLWVAHFGGARVTRYAPDGRTDRVIPLPVPCPTACTFGGRDLDTLFVTTARIGLDEQALKEAPLSGSLFAISTGARGLPEPEFAQGAR
ncbi:SMP-30/gluconolactonase/LRE family protein [Bosea thiooxidans]|nr:SMP-30/gluconolactonase/LRE family protein [Bosea sp. (in: a-proteobacteria)]